MTRCSTPVAILSTGILSGYGKRHARTQIQYTCKMNPSEEGWYRVAPENCPENYGFNAVPHLRSPAGKCRGSGVPLGRQVGRVTIPSTRRKPAGDTDFVAVTREGKIRLRRNGKQHGRSGEVYCSQGCTVGPLVVGCHWGLRRNTG